MAGANNETLRRRLTAIAGAVAGFTVAIVILVFVYTAYEYERHRIEARAELAAADLSKLAYARPDTWMFQEKRLDELIATITPPSNREPRPLCLRVLDKDGNEVIKLGTSPGFPSISARSDIADGFTVVGSVELTESAVHIWRHAIPVSLIGLALALAIFIVLRVLPIRALLRREAALEAAQKMSRESEMQLRLVTDAMPVLIGYVDSNEYVRVINKTGENWFARPRAEILGQPIHHMLPGQLRNKTDPHVAAALSGKVATFEHNVTYPDKIARQVRGRYIPDIAPDGRVLGYFGLIEDVTAQRATEEQLRQAQKTEALGQLTGGIAHDFNNLLGIILGNIEMLRDRQADDPLSLGMVDSALKATLRGGELTQRLLAFSRKQALAPRVVAVNELTASTAELLRRTIAATIRIETVLAPDLWPAIVDPGQLENAIVNLAVNARDALSAGGMLTIETKNVEIGADHMDEFAEFAPGQYVSITVSDTGTGMSREVQQRVFEPFFTTKEVGKGSGLGLSMVYGFVKQTGGHVKIYSEAGEGTSIRLYLPVAKPDQGAGEMAEIADVALPMGRGETILVVEDSEALRLVAAAHLEALGYAVLQAEDGPVALALLAERPDVDLLFTDIVLPNGMHGGEVARQAQARYPALKVLYASGYSRSALMQRGRLEEGLRLLNKPYRKQDLARSIRAALDETGVARKIA